LVRPLSTFPSSHSHLNATRIHQPEQESPRLRSAQRFANTAAGIADLIAWARPLAAERIVFESTGP
jgi:hypothetical protein